MNHLMYFAGWGNDVQVVMLYIMFLVAISPIVLGYLLIKSLRARRARREGKMVKSSSALLTVLLLLYLSPLVLIGIIMIL